MKQLDEWVGGSGDYLFIQCYRIPAEEHAPSLASRSILRSFAFLLRYHGVLGLRHKSSRVPVSGRKQIDSPKGSNYLTSTV
jgi:hypothetical protein